LTLIPLLGGVPRSGGVVSLTFQHVIMTLTICALGAAGVVFAQDAADGSTGGPVNTDNAVTAADDADGNAVDADNPEKSGKPGKSGKSSKSEKKSDGAVAESAEFDPAAEVSKPSKPGKSKSKSKSGKSDESVSVTEPSAKEKKPAKEKPAADEGTTIKYNGLVAAGVDFNSKENKRQKGDKAEAMASKRVAKGELELSAQPVKKVRAEIGLEYNANGRAMIADSLGVRKFSYPIDPYDGIYALTDVDVELLKGLGLGPFVTIDKLYAQYNIIDNGTIRAGIIKKAFGLEERAGLDERCFLKSSIINDGLETLGFLDHDLTIAYRHDLLNDALRLIGAFSWSMIDSLAYLQNYSAHYRPDKNTEFILAGIVRHYSANDTLKLKTSTRLPTLLTTFAASLSFRYDAAFCVSEAEVTVGTNPDTLLTKNRTAALFGARLQEQFPINVNTKILRSVVPVAEAALYTADIDSGHTDTQIKVGVTLGFAKNSAFQFRNNFGTIIRTANGESKVRRYRFDSEVVVIF